MKIAVVNSFMNDAHREKISAAAAQHSMEVAYYKTNDEALPHLADVDIIYAAATGGADRSSRKRRRTSSGSAVCRPALIRC